MPQDFPVFFNPSVAPKDVKRFARARYSFSIYDCSELFEKGLDAKPLFKPELEAVPQPKPG